MSAHAQAGAASRTQARSIASFFSGNLAVTATSLVASMLVTRWTEPYQMGLWNFALLLATYSSVAQLGVFNALNRQMPYYLGRGEEEASTRMAEVARFWAIGLAMATLAASLAAAAFFRAQGDRNQMLTALALGLFIACAWHQQFLTVCYSARGEFPKLARKLAIVAFAGLPLTLLAKFLGYSGLLLRAGLLAIMNVWTLHQGRPVRVRARWDAAAFKELVKIGFPIWLLGQLGTLAMTLDRLVLADDPQRLGYYTIAAQFAAMSAMIPQAFNAVIYPQMARQYGSSHSARDLWNIALKAAGWLHLAALGAGILAWILIPPFVELVLPNYMPGVEAARWAALVGLAQGCSVFTNIFNVLGKQRVYLLAGVLGVAVFFGTWHFLADVRGQAVLTSAAQSMLAATLATSLSSALFSRWVCRRHDREHNKMAAAQDGPSQA